MRAPPPFGPAAAIALLCGVVFAQTLPALPPLLVAGISLLVALIASVHPSKLRLAAIAALGLSWACLRADLVMSSRLPFEADGTVQTITARVVDIPEVAGASVRFECVVDGLGRVRLSWFKTSHVPLAGETWQFDAKLRRPRGAVNPGGFDFERFAAERRLVATGYVRSGERVAAAGFTGAIDRARLRFSQSAARVLGESTSSALVRALAVGDTSGISPDAWATLRATGTTHLVAISGMHVGLAASLGVLLSRLLYRFGGGLALHLARPRADALLALMFASAYALLAGASLPVLRTLLMIVAVLANRWLARRQSAPHALALAAIALMIADPLAVLAPGFWLSFAGVGWLLFCLGGRARERLPTAFTRAQLAVSLGLFPLTIWFFQQASLIGPLANFVAVPWISLVCVPLCLLSLAMWLVAPQLAEWPLRAADYSLRGIVELLESLATLSHAEVHLATPTAASLVLCLIGAALLLAPSAVPGRALGAFLCLPLMLPPDLRPPHGEFDIRALDVGQGLSVLVQTRTHALLYDAGPASDDGYDAGASVVVPTLHALGVGRLDAVVVSHEDRDHAGGASAVIAAFPHARVYRNQSGKDATPCEAGKRWHWDGVTFEWLHPPAKFPDLGNDSSCVLRLSSGEAAALLPGDITETVESRLIREWPAKLQAAVLVAPHHGSRTSSSEAFIAAVDPAFVLYARGYRHHFGHPAAAVVRRYADADAARLDTAVFGATTLRIGPTGVERIESQRQSKPRWWREASLIE